MLTAIGSDPALDTVGSFSGSSPRTGDRSLFSWELASGLPSGVRGFNILVRGDPPMSSIDDPFRFELIKGVIRSDKRLIMKVVRDEWYTPTIMYWPGGIRTLRTSEVSAAGSAGLTAVSGAVADDIDNFIGESLPRDLTQLRFNQFRVDAPITGPLPRRSFMRIGDHIFDGDASLSVYSLSYAQSRARIHYERGLQHPRGSRVPRSLVTNFTSIMHEVCIHGYISFVSRRNSFHPDSRLPALSYDFNDNIPTPFSPLTFSGSLQDFYLEIFGDAGPDESPTRGVGTHHVARLLRAFTSIGRQSRFGADHMPALVSAWCGLVKNFRFMSRIRASQNEAYDPFPENVLRHSTIVVPNMRLGERLILTLLDFRNSLTNDSRLLFDAFIRDRRCTFSFLGESTRPTSLGDVLLDRINFPGGAR